MQIPVDIACIATASAPYDPASGQEMLDMMMSRLPFAASCLTVYNPLDRTHRAIASTGYDPKVLSYLTGRFVTEDVAYDYYQSQGRRQKALKWAEMPFDYKSTYSVQEVFLPAGFSEGVTLCLYSRDVRYTGDLHISTDDPRFPSSDMMTNIVQCLQTILGNFSDLLRDVTRPHASRFKGGRGCVITTDGKVIDLPGIPQLPETLRDELNTRLARLEPRQIPEVFLYKHQSIWYRVYTGMLQGGARPLVVEQYQLPYGITARELEIIELLISGATNSEIASRTFVAPSTVSKHLENIFDKLDCNNRTSVVSTALMYNLRHLPAARSSV
ncbi:response regulator transcription factor [Mesorhizobium sp. A623]